MAGLADYEGLSPFPGHEGGPRGLVWSWFAEPGELGDLVDCHRAVLPAQLAPAGAEPMDQLLVGCEHQDRNGIGNDRVLVSRERYPAEPCYQVLLAVAMDRGLKARARPVRRLDLGLVPGRDLGHRGLVPGG